MLAETAAATTNAPEWSVSDLAQALRRTLEDNFGHVRLRGEISGYRGPHGSGHVYFSLKDADACIDAVIWRSSFARLRFRPQEGLEVIATGKITTFAGKSKYQIVIDGIEPAGAGGGGPPDGAPRRAPPQACRRGPVRRRPEEAAAVHPAGDRRRDLADRRRHPRHPARALRPLPAPRPRVAGAGPGRALGRGGRGGDPRLQRAFARWPGAAAGCDHR